MSAPGKTDRFTQLLKSLLDLTKNWAFAVGLVVSGGVIFETSLSLKFKICVALLMILSLLVIASASQIFIAEREVSKTVTHASSPWHKAKFVLLFSSLTLLGWATYSTAMDYITEIRTQHRNTAKVASAACPAKEGHKPVAMQ